jgi:hypothetical protein
MENFAPVLIPTLNRFNHFKNCIESLSECKYADKTELFIAVDYPLNDYHRSGNEEIKKYCYKISGFKKVNVWERKENYGIIKNYQESMNSIFNLYDQVIFTEDDNMFSSNFLIYMNKGLSLFEKDPKISAICGYNFPVKVDNLADSNIFYYRGFSAWGFATWKQKFDNRILTIEDQYNFLLNKNNVFELQKCSHRHIYTYLKNIYYGHSIYGDSTLFIKNILKGQYSVFPVVSKVRNTGNDGSGHHCLYINSNIFENQELDQYSGFDYNLNEVETNTDLFNKRIRNYFNLTYKQKLYLLFLKALFNINNLLKRKKD